MTTPTSDKSNAVPTNVANILAELHRMAASGNPDVRTEQRQRANQTSALVIRGK